MNKLVLHIQPQHIEIDSYMIFDKCNFFTNVRNFEGFLSKFELYKLLYLLKKN